MTPRQIDLTEIHNVIAEPGKPDVFLATVHKANEAPLGIRFTLATQATQPEDGDLIDLRQGGNTASVYSTKGNQLHFKGTVGAISFQTI